MITNNKKQTFIDELKSRIIQILHEDQYISKERKQNFIRFARNSMIILTNNNPIDFDKFSVELFEEIATNKTTDYNKILNDLFEKVKEYDFIPSEEFTKKYPQVIKENR